MAAAAEFTSSKLSQWATSPFDNPAADTILRTSDDVDFRVHSIILSEASPFYKDMFPLPQPLEGQPRSQAQTEVVQPYHEGRPVIPVDEESTTLDALLRLCYPVTDPELTDVQLVRAVLAAALKYQMDEATAITTRELRSFAPNQPIRIWAIACILHLEDEARRAARLAVAGDQDISTVFPDEMKELSAGHYFRLLQYHRLQGKVPDDFRFLSPPRLNLSESHQPKSPVHNIDSLISLAGELRPDLICRSSDGVEIPVHKVILAMASSVLRDRIMNPALSTPRSAHSDPEILDAAAQHLLCLDLPEDGKTLAAVIHLCYPIRSSELRIYDLVATRNILVVARDYAMYGVQELLESHLEAFVVSQPLAAYFVAIQLNLSEHAKRAAKVLLERPIADTYVAEMEAAPALVYFRLLRYYAAACNTATSCLATLQNAVDKSPDCPHAFYTEWYHSQLTVACMCNWYNERLAGVWGAMAACPVKPDSTKLEVLLEEAIQGQGICSGCMSFARRLLILAVKTNAGIDVPAAQVQLEV